MTSPAPPQFPVASLGALERYRVRGGTPSLDDVDPKDTTGLSFTKAEIKAATAVDVAEIDRLSEILYAEAKRAVLVILQGLDTSGKDGTIRKVFSPVDPLGVLAVSFKAPTPAELAHDFLWRIHKQVPAVGMIGLFNRSHYEDVLTARVRRLAPAERIEKRYDEINGFERHLVENDVTLLKFYLHISKKEQRERLQARLDDPTKRWKFHPDDLEDRAHWDEYMEAYRIALERCSPDWAPWFIVPADRKWYRNAVVARIVRTVLEAMGLSYPPAIPGFDKVRVE